MIVIAGYEVDVAVTEVYNRSATPTSHPVEEGAEITDHVIAMPLTITLQCIISDTPFGELAERRAASGLFVGAAGEGFVPSDDAHRFFNELLEDKKPFTYEGSRGTFDNMVVANLTEPHNATTGDSLRFDMTIQQIDIQETDRTTVRVANPRSRRRQNTGTKTPTAFAGTVAEPIAQLVKDDGNRLRRLIPF